MAVRKRPLVVAGIVSLAVLAVGGAFVRLAEARRIEEERRAITEAGQTRVGALEREIGRSADAAYALELAVRGSDRVAAFEPLATGILARFSAVEGLALAPDGIVTQIHPANTIGWSGLDRNLFRNLEQKVFAAAARRSGRFLLSRPVTRGKSGAVLYGYLPVFRPDAKSEDRFWGFAIVAMPLPHVLEASDLPGLTNEGYEYRLSCRDASSQRWVVFARSGEPELEDPVRMTVRMPGGEWSLSIARRAATRLAPSLLRNATLVLALSLLVGLVVYNLLRQPEILRTEMERRTDRLAEANRQVINEIVQRERAETQLLFEASHDSLTGLPNRAFLISRLAQALDQLNREPGHEFALFLIGLDRFKSLNDSLGPLVGDELLIATKRRLEICLRPGDVLARVGGDEFAVLLFGARRAESLVPVARRLQDSLSRPLLLQGKEVFMTASIGIAFDTVPGQPEDFLRDADLAMRAAKSEGGGRHAIFDRSMRDRAVMLLNVETDLRRAVEREELRVHYQPIVSLSTGRITGFEALVRWQHPERGLIEAASFIPVAESTGLVVSIDRWVWSEASRRIRALHERFPKKPPVSISVNVSARHLNEPDLYDQIGRTLQTSGLSAHLLRIEVTESMMMENAQTARQVLVGLKELQIELLLDDFGTGYSSLSYLHELPIDVLKIDRSFVKRLGSESKYTEIVRTIIRLGHGLGMDVIAEGIETQDQLARLRALGCGYGQGFFFSAPIQTDALDPLIASERRW